MSELLLALDPEEFVESAGIAISIEEPVLHRLDTLLPGLPGSPDAARVQVGSVVHDRSRQCCRMWYTAYPEFTGDLAFPSRPAYAESRDGVVWTKPELGLVEYRGSRRNNLLSGIPELCGIEAVIRDDDGTYLAALNKVGCLTADMIEDAALRQQCDAYPMPAFMGIVRSRDGLSWEYDGDLRYPAIREKYEMVRLMKMGRHYLLSGQQMRPWCEADVYERMVTFFVSEDLVHWEKLPGFYRAEGHVQSHIGIAMLGEYGHTLLGFAGRFSDAPELPDQAMEVDLVRSRSGLNWRQVAPCRPYLRRGPVGSWNAGSILQAQGCVDLGDEQLFYFSGGTAGNCPVGNIVSPGYVRIPRHRFGFAGLKVGWDIGFRGVRQGHLRTRTLHRTAPHERLFLNCGNFVKNGQIRAALTDETGHILPGFSLAQSIPVRQDGLAVPLCWQQQPGMLPDDFQLLLALEGGTFRNESPRLYAIMLNPLS